MSVIVFVMLGGAAAAAVRNPAPARAAHAGAAWHYPAPGRGDHRSAYRAWGRDGRASGQRYARFAREVAAIRRGAMSAGTPTRPEGAAGSVHVRVPMTVRATSNGTVPRFVGRYTLRRVSNVDGASPRDRRRHIDGAAQHRQ